MSISVPSAWHEASLQEQDPQQVLILRMVGCRMRDEKIWSPDIPSRKSIKLFSRWHPFLEALPSS